MGDEASQRREQILQAAARLLHHYGPAKTTVADIAREAGVGVGSVYLEFDSKDAIIGALSEGHHEEILARMRAAVRADQPALDQLRAMLTARVQAFLELASDGAHARDLFHCKCQGVNDAHARFQHRERALLIEVLQRARQRNECIAQPADELAETILLAHASLTPPDLFQHSPDTLHETLRRLHDVLLRGLRQHAQ